MTPPFVKQGNPQGELFTALANMLTQAQPSSTMVDAPYVAQMSATRQQNEFERAKEQDYYNKVRALAELRAQGSTPSAMFQRANNFVGDFITGNTPQQMVENIALDAVPIGKLFAALAPLAKVAKRVDDIPPITSIAREIPNNNYTTELTRHGVNRLYREMDADRAFSFIDPMTHDGYMKQSEYYFSDVPELAIGQGGNRGIVVELNPSGLMGRADFSKPLSKQMYREGRGEFIAKFNDQKQYLDNLVGVTIKPDLTVSSSGAKRRLKSVLQRLETFGFSKTMNPDGSITYRRE